MYQEGESSTNQSKGKSPVLDLNQNCSLDLSYEIVESEAEKDTPAVIAMGFSISEIKPNSIDLNYPPLEGDTCKVIENRPIAPVMTEDLLKSLLTVNQQKPTAAGIQSTTKEEAEKKYIKRPKDYAKNLSFDDICKYFDRPSAEASACLNIGETLLKKKCREFGILKWPYRKIKSLDNLIHNIKEEVERLEPLDKTSRDEALKRQQILESEREFLMKRPVFEIKRDTKKLRQDGEEIID
ncbi:Rkd5 [Thalictrum thalictroides]|uniref:Rkd5 n=1 Tax=Thalictrum thalictroides TaxID=46969 RepID=A0A7J6W3Q4_THATH|nr:Rkd5 [Thalictrum thalictroides]